MFTVFNGLEEHGTLRNVSPNVIQPSSHVSAVISHTIASYYWDNPQKNICEDFSRHLLFYSSRPLADYRCIR